MTRTNYLDGARAVKVRGRRGTRAFLKWFREQYSRCRFMSDAEIDAAWERYQRLKKSKVYPERSE